MNVDFLEVASLFAAQLEQEAAHQRRLEIEERGQQVPLFMMSGERRVRSRALGGTKGGGVGDDGGYGAAATGAPFKFNFSVDADAPSE